MRYSWERKFIRDFADKCLSAQDDLAMILQSLFAVIDTKRVIYNKIVTKGRLTDRKLVAVVFARE